jgi:hypothetical protein
LAGTATRRSSARSAYVLAGEARWHWQHSIPPLVAPLLDHIPDAASERTQRRAAQPRQRHLGRGHSPDPGREAPLHHRAHQQHAGRFPRRHRHREAHLRGSTPTEKQPRGFAIDSRGKFLVASGEKSETISVYAIDPVSGTLRLLNKYPVGKGANWVEIVSFD